ncbi:MAG: dockerin type I domain-containing protein [Chloroflexota bacterium]
MNSVFAADSVLTVNTLDNVKDGVCDLNHCSLRDAIVTANNMSYGTFVEINLMSGTYYLDEIDNTIEWMELGNPIGGNSATPLIQSNITIQGNSQSIITRNDNAPFLRFFLVGQDGRLTLDGITMTNGDIGPDYLGGAIASVGDLTLQNIILQNNRGRTAGAVAHYQGELRVDGSQFVGNEAYGGEFYPYSGGWGGALYVRGGGINSVNKDAVIQNSIFEGNLSRNRGAAIFALFEIEIIRNIFLSNQIKDATDLDESGGSAIYQGSNLPDFTTIRNNCIVDNTEPVIYSDSSGSLPLDATQNWWGNSEYLPEVFNTRIYPPLEQFTDLCPFAENVRLTTYGLTFLQDLSEITIGENLNYSIEQQPGFGDVTIQEGQLTYNISDEIPTDVFPPYAATIIYRAIDTNGLPAFGYINLYFPLWDTNRDCKVTPSDAIYSLNRLEQPVTANNANADVNNDGSITEADVTEVEIRLGLTVFECPFLVDSP